MCVKHDSDSVKEWQYQDDYDAFMSRKEVKLKNSDILNGPCIKTNHLLQKQRLDVQELLEGFRDIFADVPQPSPVVTYEVRLVEGAVPVKQSPYRVSPAKRQILKDEVQFLLQHGLAETSNSEWASPCVLVPKPDGTFRLCTDYRKVNQFTRADCYPLPRIEDVIDSVGNAAYVTKLDLLKGYYQVPLSEEAKKISAFVTPDGLYQYTVLPFGMRNAPAVFQRLMSAVTTGLEGVSVYLDDLVVHSSSWPQHLATLKALFQRLSDAKLTVNLIKSEFGHARIIFLGHVVGGGIVAPVAAKVEAICNLPIPTNRKAVQRFLGMAGFYRRYCPNFSEVAAPLTDLVSPRKKFVWSPACQTAFDNVRSILVTTPVLRAPDFSRPFQVQVDASDVGAGAVLLQTDEDDIMHPICYMSTKFKSYQRNYSTIEKEAIALFMALEKFEIYLSNPSQKFIVYSDHNPLQFVSRMKNKNQRLTRWWLTLQSYNMEIRHIKGKDNLIADALSRAQIN